MDRLPNGKASSETVYDRGIDVARPERQPGYVVTAQEWDYIKERVESIRAGENLWLSVALSCLTATVSFLISVTQFQGESIWITIFWMAVSGGAAGTIVCGVAWWASKKRREDDIKSVLNYMGRIDRMYRD